MKKIMTLLLFYFITCSIIIYAQDSESVDPARKTDWWGDIDGFLNRQAEVTLEIADKALNCYPPDLEMPLIRKMALQMIDNVMHEEKAPEFQSVQKFLQNRIRNAIKDIKEKKIDSGAVIWKLYNHTFIVKTSTVTIGFDIQRGFRTHKGYLLDKGLLKELVNLTDILFISHLHNDHADKWVAETFIDNGKPVIAPPDLWKDDTLYSKILHLEREPHTIQNIALSGNGSELKIVVYPGHQGESVFNNVYLVYTPEGLTFLHTGDQSNLTDFVWIDKISDFHKVDVLMTNSWSVYPDNRLFRGCRPRLILPGHENELGHTIDHREPYWLNYIRLPEVFLFPWIQMTWGESYHLK